MTQSMYVPSMRAKCGNPNLLQRYTFCTFASKNEILGSNNKLQNIQVKRIANQFKGASAKLLQIPISTSPSVSIRNEVAKFCL
jgi:hypothetical protein